MKTISLDDWKKELLEDATPELITRYNTNKITSSVVLVFLNYRKEKNITQKQLADELGISVRTVKNIEQFDGDKVPFRVIAESLAKLGKTITITDRVDEAE